MKNSNNVPMRRCVACRESKPKSELIRFVKLSGEATADSTGSNDTVAALDKSGKAPGRGFYTCPNPECIRKARKKRIITETLMEEAIAYANEI